jgi:uncharacterized surface protein with fasciclin (FAS1) repeats
MFQKKSLFTISFFVILALVLAACAPAATPEPTPVPTEEPTEVVEPEPQSIVDIAVADGRFTTLVSALQAAGLADTLAGEGPFTVFAPTDEAFAKLPEGTIEALLADIPALTDILLYHVVSGQVLAEDVVMLEEAETLLGEAVSIKVENGMVYLNEDVQVIITDIIADNGVIHVIDSVLLPVEPLGTIVDIAVADGRFTTLVSALQAADLADTLAGEGPFTVFAPTDEAFAKLPEGTIEALLEDIPALTDILLYHVVSGEVLAEDVVMLEEAETLLGEAVSIKVENGMVYLNEDVQVVITDILADNGVIHVIDSVLLPPEPLGTIVDIAVEDGRFTTLVSALQAADLADTLAGEGPFTVFAPTDEAFDKLPEGTLEALLADIPALTDILLYHVVSGEVLAEDVVALEEAETLLEQMISIKVEDGKVYLNEDVQVIITDILADNGVIHVIDAVLLPPES